MKKQLTKIFTTLIAVLIATSLIAVFPVTAENPTTDKYTVFMENVLSVDMYQNT
jgi:hypothetical protein